MRERPTRKYLTKILWAVFLSFLIGGEILILVLMPLDHKEHPNQSGYEKEPCGQIQTGASYGEAARYYGCAALFKNLIFVDVYHDTINAFAALAVALFTFTLWRSTTDLWRAGEKQLKIAEASAEALQASERAYVVELIDGGDFHELYRLATWYKKSPEMKADPVAVPVQLRFKNYGKTPATIISYGYKTTVSKEAPDFSEAPSDKFLEEPTIAEKTETRVFETSQIVPHTWVQSMQLGQHDLRVWLIGNIFYLDVFDTITTRSFIWRYDDPMRKLVPYRSETGRQRKSES